MIAIHSKIKYRKNTYIKPQTIILSVTLRCFREETGPDLYNILKNEGDTTLTAV